MIFPITTRCFNQEEVIDVFKGDNGFALRTRQVVNPFLQASLRKAEWVEKDPEVGDEEWDT